MNWQRSALVHGSIHSYIIPVGLEIIISGSLLEEENRPFILLLSFVKTPPPPAPSLGVDILLAMF